MSTRKDRAGVKPCARRIAGNPRQTQILLHLEYARSFYPRDSMIGIRLAPERLKTTLRCLIASVIDRTIHCKMKGYDDERSHKRKIHDGPPIAEKLPRNELGGPGDGGVCGPDCKCSREGEYAKCRTRSFLERPGTGEQASSDRKPRLQYSSTDG